MSPTPAARAVATALDLDPERLPAPVTAVVAVVEDRGFTDGDRLTDRETRRARVALAAADVQDAHRRDFLRDDPGPPGGLAELTGR